MGLTRSQLSQNSWKPVVFMNGDDSTRRGALMVRDIVFPDFSYVDVDTGVDARVASNDACLDEAAAMLAHHRAGIKISTASNDPRIRERGWKSANIVLRPKAGVIGMYRQTMAPGGYRRPVAVMRFGSGDFYSETACKPISLDGLEAREITQHLIIGYLEPFARAAAERAKRHGLQMVLSSKWTISEGETYLPDICEKVFQDLGLTIGEKRGEGDAYREIADMAGAYIPVNVGPSGDCAMSMDNGGWMIVCGNANGDTFADIADLQHGGNSMGSECICHAGFSYFELPGGTAPGRKDSDFKGDKFFSPMGTLVAFAGAITSVNPEA
ncbi:MAG: hypothetical protein KDD44_08545, partial [Bdellovibrionales bacterium]|nr:hypothetical protein [Bdellovibrionales bacterium]